MGTEVAPPLGYYRYPTIAGDQVIFVSEDDLWTVSVHGGVARRLTSGVGKISSVALSPDGRYVAFSSSEEGNDEIYLMPAEGGEVKRLTYLGCTAKVAGWTPQGEILFTSNHQQAFARMTDAYRLNLEHLEITPLPCGPVAHVDIDRHGRMVIARYGGTELAHWKRYKGGTAGQIWVDLDGHGNFKPLFRDKTVNSARPYWIGDRIFFLSDFEGIANVYSADLKGEDLKRHTDCREYYARGLSVHGNRLIYHAGGELFLLDTDGGEPRKLEFEYRSPRTQANRRFVSASKYLEDYDLDPKGERAVIAARGKTFSFDLWKGPVYMHGQEGPLRCRLGRFLNDGQRIALVSDMGGEESLEIHDVFNRTKVERLSGLDLGRARDMKLSPNADEALITNHRHELIWVDLGTGKSNVIDRSEFEPIRGFNWSPDGRYVAYACSESLRCTGIRIADLKTGKIRKVTRPVLQDVMPYFSPDGDYLYFLSYRVFDPVYDNLRFDLGFPRGCRAYLITLRKDVIPPFSSDHPKFKTEKDSENEDKKKAKATKPKKIVIDFDGIEERIVQLPVPDGRYRQIAATREKVYLLRLPIKGSIEGDWRHLGPETDATLEMLDLETERLETLVSGVSSFRLSQDGKQIIYRSGNSLRVIKAGEKPSRERDDRRRGGWLDLNRVQIPVHPRSEWRQMYREAWRLQRDHFWTEDMSKVDWEKVYHRYLPLLDRVNTRSEVSDVIKEMQGELGTSHAYEIGGDYRRTPEYTVGFLGAEWTYDEKAEAYRLTRVMKGDLWDERASSPLARAGVGLEAGDYLVAINGQPLSRDVKPEQLLVHRADQEVSVSFRRASKTEVETRAVRTLHSEQQLRYREWVNANREWVHKKSRNRVGYVHIPNMGPFGYAEFFRSFLTELDFDGLIIDVRFNGGGHVSQLLLEKLARRRIGFTKSRWSGVFPYPLEAPAGPLVALTNEQAGSDGDIFSHAFKLLKLGPLVGKRTWGGVIGINPAHSLVDGGFTTQPEYSHWFEDVGWGVENYGTDPDFEVEILPSDYVAGRDPQLEKALELVMERMARQPPLRPRFDSYPDLSLPEIDS